MIILYSVICIVAGVLGLRMDALNKMGALASVIVGTAVAFGFGWRGLVLLGVFFVTSTGWSKYKCERKNTINQIVVKGAARDEAQVFANGGAAAFAGLMMGIFPSTWWLAFFISALATSIADTWASEIGVLSKKPPFHILNLKLVPRGTSGAVSILGFLASIVAASLLSGVGFLLFGFSSSLFLAATFAGILGCLLDTIIGATIQEEFYCERCEIKTEHHYHCGHKTIQTRGVRGINNDAVNIISSVCGGLAGGVWFL
ncbi:DUF92 domain-containing protein [Guptibacillus algicola]|uniref:DUF92 domain-containing protein n=1 Tax=Guptibacillus algicola TaxID=225844 RepID=UPI001CD1BF0E|nr:DUF92 domain-containing protein [Alkalihalobacillus algicola]MCA0986039.1 DUF92 domain-containing protein [Alkalihalobacillus algicola]